MSDAIAGSAAWLGGTEIVNDSRTTAYMQNGIKPSTLNVAGDCGCSNVLALAGCDTGYNTPAIDNAPWYDPNIPESAEFAGFLSTGFEGMSSTYTRAITESIADGATLGRSRFGSRMMTWKGFLFGSSCCGVAYGLRWLGKTLQGSKNCGNNCFGDDLELLVCCPTTEAAQGFGPNLICNSAFKNDTGSWASSGNTAISWTNYPNHTDIGSLKVINPIGGAIAFNTNCTIPVTQNKKYQLGFYAKADVAATSQTIGATFTWYNILGSSLGSNVVSSVGTDNSSTWTFLSTTVTAPVGAVTVQVNFTVGDSLTLPNQTHFLDDVTLNQTNFAATVEPFRTIKGVSLHEGPHVLSERKMGTSCGGVCGGAAVVEVEFSLVAAQPWLYSAPIPVVNCVNVQQNAISIIGGRPSGTITDNPLSNVAITINSAGFTSLPLITSTGSFYITLDPLGVAGLPEIVRVIAHAAGATSITVVRAQQGTAARSHLSGVLWQLQTDCSPANCGDGLLAQIPGCAPPSLPPTAVYIGCITPDVNKYKAVYISAPRALWSSLSEVVPVITIQTGGFPLVGARLGFFTSADGNPCGDLINTPPSCDLICDTLSIIAIPGNSKFYIDGRTKKMSIVCGTNAVFPAEPYTLGPFSWPSFDCYGFCMEFAYDPSFIANDLCVSLSLVPRTTQ